MEIRLQLLETFTADGSDGRQYKVCAYDRLARDESIVNGEERWEPIGQMEYRLEDGRLVDVTPERKLRIARSDVLLSPQGRHAEAVAANT